MRREKLANRKTLQVASRLLIGPLHVGQSGKFGIGMRVIQTVHPQVDFQARVEADIFRLKSKRFGQPGPVRLPQLASVQVVILRERKARDGWAFRLLTNSKAPRPAELAAGLGVLVPCIYGLGCGSLPPQPLSDQVVHDSLEFSSRKAAIGVANCFKPPPLKTNPSSAFR